MRGSILLPISVLFSIIIPSFSLLISSNSLTGLVDAGKTLSSQINGLRIPFDIDYAVSKYADKKDKLYEEKLRSAWESAAKAREASSEIQKIASGAKLSLVNGGPKIEIDLNINNREAETRGYFESAVKDSYYVLQGLVDLLDSDKEELDLLGADNQNFSRSQVFDGLFDFLDDINAETGRYDYATRIEANPCSLDDLKHRTICIVRQMGMLQKPSAEQAVSIFNQIIGYPGPSLLEDYFEYHKNLSSVMLQMQNDYEDSLNVFDQRVSGAQEKLAALKEDKIFLVNQGVMNTITGQSGSNVLLVAGQGSSLSEKFIYLGKELEAALIGRGDAERTLGQKQDDYLFIATEKVRELDFLLSELLSSAGSLQNSLVELRDRAKNTYDRLIQENAGKKTTALYLAALGIGNESKNSLGEEIIDYSKAISYLSFVQSSDSILTLDSDFEYLKKVLKSLDSFGLDVSYEKEQYDRLVQINDEKLYPQVYLSVQGLVSKLRGKADFGIRKVYALRDQLAGYFADYRAFLAEPRISQKLDRKKIDGLEKDFENSLTFDELSNLDELYRKYTAMGQYLGSAFDSIASEYLSGFVTYSYDFLSPICQNLSRARVLLSVKNPSSVTFSDVTISKKHNLIGDLENPVLLYINSIGPGEIRYKEYFANVFYNCSDNASAIPNKTQIDKRFFDMSNRIAQLCLFRDCSDLKKLYKEAYSKSDIETIEGALSDGINDFLSNFTAKDIKKRLERIDLMLADFNKAVDSKVGFDHNISLIYSVSDYSQASSQYGQLKSIYTLLSPISFSSKSTDDRFDELVNRFSPSDITDFFDNTIALEGYLNSSLESVRNEAKSSLLLAKQNFDENKQGYDYLKKALDSYNKGNYNRAILFASRVPDERIENQDFTYLIYLALAIVLALFCIFLIRKPKQERKVMRRLLRATS